MTKNSEFTTKVITDTPAVVLVSIIGSKKEIYCIQMFPVFYAITFCK